MTISRTTLVVLFAACLIALPSLVAAATPPAAAPRAGGQTLRVEIDLQGHVLSKHVVPYAPTTQSTQCGGLAPLQPTCSGSSYLGNCCSIFLDCGGDITFTGEVLNTGRTSTGAYKLDCYVSAGIVLLDSLTNAGNFYLGQTMVYQGKATGVGDWYVGVYN